jgi:hypothetical protein
VSVTISVTACFDVCDQPSQWGPGTVLYNGAFNPQFNTSAPAKGLYQDFALTLPEGWPNGESVLQVGHLFKLGVSIVALFSFKCGRFCADIGFRRQERWYRTTPTFISTSIAPRDRLVTFISDDDDHDETLWTLYVHCICKTCPFVITLEKSDMSNTELVFYSLLAHRVHIQNAPTASTASLRIETTLD